MSPCDRHDAPPLPAYDAAAAAAAGGALPVAFHPSAASNLGF